MSPVSVSTVAPIATDDAILEVAILLGQDFRSAGESARLNRLAAIVTARTGQTKAALFAAARSI